MADERLFLGLPFTESARDEIATALAAADLSAVPGRPAPRANWHLTLRFLGRTAPSVRLTLLEAVRERDLGPTAYLRFRGWGCFPRPARAHVLFLDVDDPEGRLAGLAAIAEAAARETGFPPEVRDFRPHLTILRAREATDLRELIATLPPVDLPMTAERVALFRSVPGSGPARYEIVEEFRLAPG